MNLAFKVLNLSDSTCMAKPTFAGEVRIHHQQIPAVLYDDYLHWNLS